MMTDAEMRMAANAVRVEVLNFITEYTEREGTPPAVELVVNAILEKHPMVEGTDAGWFREAAKEFIRECAAEICKEFAADQSSDKPQ